MNLNKGSELLSYCRVLVEWVLFVMMWHIPLDVVLDVLQYRLFALSFVSSLSACLADMESRCLTADGSYSAGSAWLISPLMSYMRRIVSFSFI